MLITKEQLARFSGVVTDADSVAESLTDIYIESAEQEIRQYVGFDPLLKEEWRSTVTVYSSNGQKFYSDAEMTKEVEISYGEVPVETEEENKWEYVHYTIPGIFRHVCLEIASLMQQEESGNLGVNSKSFETGSRTFLNVVDYSKYLARLSAFREGDALKA